MTDKTSSFGETYKVKSVECLGGTGWLWAAALQKNKLATNPAAAPAPATTVPEAADRPAAPKSDKTQWCWEKTTKRSRREWSLWSFKNSTVSPDYKSIFYCQGLLKTFGRTLFILLIETSSTEKIHACIHHNVPNWLKIHIKNDGGNAYWRGYLISWLV